MTEQEGTQVSTLQRPANEDGETWRAYWKQQGQPWRTEPEIDGERQKYLTECRLIKPDFDQGIYPFKGVKLRRADVEWLLTTHENGRGPIDWSDVNQWERDGLDLRGADLCGVSLNYLPLARMVGGVHGFEWPDATETQREMAAVYMQDAKFIGTHLEGANLRFAHLENAILAFTHLDRTLLRGAYLKGADFHEANMMRVRLENAVLSDEKRIGIRLVDAKLGDVNLAVVNWSLITVLGDEWIAQQEQTHDGKKKDLSTSLYEYQTAVRANRQLAVALQGQGLNEVAARFAYRAQRLQRTVFKLQGTRKFGQYLFSLFLDLLAGYGYKLWKAFIAYLIVILACSHTVRLGSL